MKAKLILSLLLVTCLIGVAGASANIVDSKTIDQNDDKYRLSLLNEIWGTDITNGELIEQIFPDQYEKNPDKMTASFYATKVVWVKPSSDDESKTCEASVLDPTTKSTTLYLIRGSSDMEEDNSEVEFTSSQKMYLPSSTQCVPYMSISTTLWRKIGTTESIVGFNIKSGTNVYKLEASETRTCEPAWYRVTGTHAATWPPGTIPSGWAGTSYTSYVYVN